MSSAKFYCENCRKEVKPNARVCPHCGRFFTAVKCPMCGFTGEGKLFALGCPNCGYSGVTGMASRPASPRDDDTPETYNVGDIDEGSSKNRPRYAPRRRSETPSWVFPLAILIMIGAFAALVIVYLTL